MTAKKIFALLGLVLGLGSFLPSLRAAPLVEIPCRVAVMDFGAHKGAATNEVNMENAEKSVGDYIAERLAENRDFIVIEKELYQERLQAMAVKTVGIIDPDNARLIGQVIGVPYIIYGNVGDIVVSDTGMSVMETGAKVHTVQSHVILRIMDVATGEIIMAAKGEGKSRSSLVSAGNGEIGVITIGSKQVSQVSVHNAVQKAAYNGADILARRLLGQSDKKK